MQSMFQEMLGQPIQIETFGHFQTKHHLLKLFQHYQKEEERKYNEVDPIVIRPMQRWLTTQSIKNLQESWIRMITFLVL